MARSSSVRSKKPNALTTLSHHWRRLVLVGGIDALAGIVSLALPGATLVALAIILGLVLLIGGAVAVQNGLHEQLWWPVILGALSIFAAILCFISPGVGAYAILFGTALLFFFAGIGEMLLASQRGANRLWWLVLGALTFIASLVMFAFPGVAYATVALTVGSSFLLRGMGELVLAARIRSLDR
ncbi:MAG: HdeD family acid-resistance protein [Mycobacteriales bacterium]